MELKLYTDGSYTRSIDRSAGAIVILHNDKPIYARRYLIEDTVFKPMQSPGAELMTALAGLYTAAGILQPSNVERMGHKEDKITLYHDYDGVAKIPNGTWSNLKKPGTIMYLRQFETFKKAFQNITVNFVWVRGHSGDKWNSVVDMIASGVNSAEVERVMQTDYVLKGE